MSQHLGLGRFDSKQTCKMAASSVLPTYQRYINGAPVTAAGRKTLRLREKYIVLLVLGTFVAVCIGTFFFLPELRSGSINTAYRHIRDAGSDLLLPPPPLYHDGSNVVRHHDVNNVDPHKIVDRAKLILKIQEDLEKERQKNLKENMDKAQVEVPLVKNDQQQNVVSSANSIDKPAQGKEADLLSQDQWLNNVAQLPMTVKKSEFGGSELNDIIRDHPGGPGTRGGEPSDPDIREKRNKIKEVSLIAYFAFFVLCLFLFHRHKNKMNHITGCCIFIYFFHILSVKYPGIVMLLTVHLNIKLVFKLPTCILSLSKCKTSYYNQTH